MTTPAAEAETMAGCRVCMSPISTTAAQQRDSNTGSNVEQSNQLIYQRMLCKAKTNKIFICLL